MTPAPPTVVSLDPPILTLVEGAAGTLTVTLNAAQPTDTEVALISSDPWWLTLSDRVTVPANTPFATFQVTGNVASTQTVTAALNGRTATAAVSIASPFLLPTLRAIACPAALAVGATGQCRLTLTTPQATETELSLAETAPDILVLPASVRFPANSLEVTFSVTGLAPGTVDVIVGPLTGTIRQATVQVVPPAPTLVGLLPNPAALAVGALTTLTVRLNAVQPTDTPIALVSSIAGILSVPPGVTVPAGRLTALIPVIGLAPGTTTLSVGPLNGTQAQTTLTVTSAPPTITAVTPADLVTFWYTAVPLTSSDPNSVQVPPAITIPAGALSAPFPIITQAPGTATITAGPLNGTSAEATITVNAAELVSFAVSPGVATLTVGQQQQFVAMGTYTDGTIEDDTWFVIWRSSDTAVARIDEWGLATARALGTSTITARLYDGSTATAMVTVTPPPLTRLSLTPELPIRALGDRIQFQVTGTYADGTTQDLTSAVTWTSSASTVASITSPGGLATVLAAGTTMVTASHPEGLTATTTLTVVLLPPTIDRLIPATGQVGTVVALIGTNLGAATQVTFNGMAAAFTIQSSTQLTATVPSGATSGPITVTTSIGTASSSGSFTVAIPPTVTISTPTAGATIPAGSVWVRGSVTSVATEVGVSVNGIPAQVNVGQWVAEVPLGPGSTVLTAKAMDATGSQATASVTVTGTEATPALLLQAVPESGVAPLVVRWQVVNQTGRPLVQFEIDENGSGTFGLPLQTLDGVQTTYTTPGLLAPSVRATDDQGRQYTATAAINVLARGPMDAVLQEKWTALRTALRANAIDPALTFFTPPQQPRFRALFTALGEQLAQVVQDLPDIQLVYLVENRAKYRFRRTELYGGQQVTFTYYVYFVQDASGLWSIEGFRHAKPWGLDRRSMDACGGPPRASEHDRARAGRREPGAGAPSVDASACRKGPGSACALGDQCHLVGGRTIRPTGSTTYRGSPEKHMDRHEGGSHSR